MIFTGTNGLATAEFIVNDTTLVLEQIHCINNSTKQVIIDLLDVDDSVKFTATFAQGVDQVRNIPPGQQITAIERDIVKSDGSIKHVIEFHYRFGDLNAAQAQQGK